MTIPEFNSDGDLPIGVHAATMEEIQSRFCTLNSTRFGLGLRLKRIHRLAYGTGCLARFVLFGSFVTDKKEPNDIDVFMLMDDQFDASALRGEAQILFDHTRAQAHFGASVFWLRRLAALDGVDAAILNWQIKRGGQRRGIIEIQGE